jgi:hypothetical protein
MLRAIYPICLAALTLSATAALAQAQWNGTWKLNQAKSHMTGDTHTVTKSGNKYHYDGGSVAYDFACDGKDYPTIGGETVSCRETPTTLDSTYKHNGKTEQTIKRQLDAGGKSYSSTSTYFIPAGGTNITKTTFTRVGQGSGMAGTWKSVSTSSSHVGSFIMKATGNSMHFESPEDHATWDGKLDGTPAAVHGPDMPNGMMVSEKLEGPRRMVTAVSMGDKHIWHAEDTLSADGKSFTEVGWDPAKPNEKQTTVYEKQ